MDEAVEWLKRAPFDEEAEVEIRPVLEADDFGKEFTPELRAQEDRMRAEVERQHHAWSVEAERSSSSGLPMIVRRACDAARNGRRGRCPRNGR